MAPRPGCTARPAAPTRGPGKCATSSPGSAPDARARPRFARRPAVRLNTGIAKCRDSASNTRVDALMTLIIDNAAVAQVLTMEDTMAALEESYLALAAGEAV